MKATGVIKRFDDLGRIHIPKDIRKKLFGGAETDYGTGQPFEVYYEDDGAIILKPYKYSDDTDKDRG
jgi:bifunctional DNA-binding transcriptional regulator/antitoxin component of YhaV-PrlF toxin-antitoxin module